MHANAIDWQMEEARTEFRFLEAPKYPIPVSLTARSKTTSLDNLTARVRDITLNCSKKVTKI